LETPTDSETVEIFIFTMFFHECYLK
jgi:hypothetical protein